MKIKIPYKPRKWATALHNAVTRWIVLIIHRRGGKTTAAFNHLQRDALRYANTRYAYIAPKYTQAKRIVWGMAKYYSRNIPGVEYNEGELLIKYANGSEIMIVGATNPDSLRGIALWGCFLDEYPQMSPVIFTEIITKCLADHKGYCIFGGTPKGKGHFYKIYKTSVQNPDRYTLVMRNIDETLAIEAGETVDNLRESLEEDKRLVKDGLMTEDEFMQEWYNSFEAAVKGAVYLKELALARKENRICGGLYDATLPVYTVWDLGVSKSDAMAVGFFQVVGKEPRLIDYLETIQEGLPGTIKKVKDRPYIYSKHFAPHDIRNREVSTGKTRLETASKLGIDFEVVPKISLEDGIDLGRAFFNRIYFDKDKAELFLDLIGSYHYEQNEKHGILSKVPVHDFTSHAADMFRYAAVIEDEMIVEKLAMPPQTHNTETDDEYVGQDEYDDSDDETPGGKHPMLRGVDIGSM